MYPLSFISRSSYLSSFFRQHAIQKQFPLSVFVFIGSLLVSASQDAGGYAISGQNNLKLPYLYVAWVILHWYTCGAAGRSGGRAGRCTVTWLPKFLGCIGYQIFLPMVLRFARERAPLLSEFITEMILTIRTDEPNIYRTYSYRDNQICFSFFRRFWRYGNYQQSIKQPSRDQEAISELPQTSVSKRGEVRGQWDENDFLFFCK